MNARARRERAILRGRRRWGAIGSGVALYEYRFVSWERLGISMAHALYCLQTGARLMDPIRPRGSR